MADRTVLLRRGALGDVVLLGAVTGAIGGEVTVVCDPRWAGVAGRLVGVTGVVPWGAPLPDGRVVDLQGSLRSAWLAPGAARIDKRSIQRRVRLWTGWGAPRPAVPALYAEAVGVAPVGPPWIATAGTRDGLALIPGAAWAPKRWGIAGFAEVGRRWSGPVWVLGGPGEAEAVAAVAAAVPGAHALIERGFDRTIDVLGRCRVAVAGDTGPMHLAGACGAAVIALFGPTHPDDGFFVYPGEVVQRTDVPCRPCALHRVATCREGHHRCMDLDPADVAEAVARCAG